MHKIISSAIGSSRLGDFETLIGKRLDDVDLSAMMVYLVDVVNESALQQLAYQFDVEGYKGFDRCTTVSQKRELIKNAIMMHKTQGSIYAVKKACSIIGVTPKAIEENVPLTVGGENVWCAFRIRLNPSDLSGFNSNTLTELKQLIGFYKNARSILTAIFFDIDNEDTIFTNTEVNRDELVVVGNLNTAGDYNLDYSIDYF